MKKVLLNRKLLNKSSFCFHNIEMLLVPAGSFYMGSNDGDSDEQPVRKVKISRAFYISKYPVTNAQYEKFFPDHKKIRPKWSGDNHPVVNVSWYDSIDFCERLTKLYAGVDAGTKYRSVVYNPRFAGNNPVCRLPTEAEWEYAARGADERRYPWGNQPPDGTRCNLADKNSDAPWRDNNIDDGFAHTSPVGHFSRGRSPFGLWDAAGNVWEWCADHYDGHAYSVAPNVDPNPSGWREIEHAFRGRPSPGTHYHPDDFYFHRTGGQYSEHSVARGGSYLGEKKHLRVTDRRPFVRLSRNTHTGFRIALEVPPDNPANYAKRSNPADVYNKSMLPKTKILPGVSIVDLSDFKSGYLEGWEKSVGRLRALEPGGGSLWTVQKHPDAEGLFITNIKDDGTVIAGRVNTPLFKISGDYISFLIGGDSEPEKCTVSLMIDGKHRKIVKRSISDSWIWADNKVRMQVPSPPRAEVWNVSKYKGKMARIRIVCAGADKRIWFGDPHFHDKLSLARCADVLTGAEFGIITSAVGYEPDDYKIAVIRSSRRKHPVAGSWEGKKFSLMPVTKGKREFLVNKTMPLFEGKVKYWGERWGIHFWVADFSSFRGNERVDENLKNKFRKSDVKNSKWVVSIDTGFGRRVDSDIFEIAPDLLWRKTFVPVAFEQPEKRKFPLWQYAPYNNPPLRWYMPPYKGGWMDCKVYHFREADSQGIHINGLLDIYEFSRDRLNEETQGRLIDNVVYGLENLLFRQKATSKFTGRRGAVNSAILQDSNAGLGDHVKCGVIMIRAYMLLRDRRPNDAKKWLVSACEFWQWIEKYGLNVTSKDIESPLVVGGPFISGKQPKEFRTRDLETLVWFSLLMHRARSSDKSQKFNLKANFLKRTKLYAREIANRQFLASEKNTEELFGDCREWASEPYHQRIWGQVGGRNDSIMPHYLIGIIELIRQFPDDKDWLLWRYILYNIGLGYLLPVSDKTPFKLLPIGVFPDGLHWFTPTWHHGNGIYPMISRIAREIGRELNDERFEAFASQNMQWVTGLNAGMFDLERGAYRPLSMIYGVGIPSFMYGERFVGSITNGFLADPEFREPSSAMVKDDGPWYTGFDEGWLFHTGGWCSGLSKMRAPEVIVETSLRGKPVSAIVRLSVLWRGKRVYSKTTSTGDDGRLKIGDLPSGARATLEVSFDKQKTVIREFALLKGANIIKKFDAADMLTLKVSGLEPKVNLKCGSKFDAVIDIKNYGSMPAVYDIRVEAIGVEINPVKAGIKIEPNKNARFQINVKAPSRPRSFLIYVIAKGRYSEERLEVFGTIEGVTKK
jgi:formylglycine-generating enzyme required for sulfatase activity